MLFWFFSYYVCNLLCISLWHRLIFLYFNICIYFIPFILISKLYNHLAYHCFTISFIFQLLKHLCLIFPKIHEKYFLLLYWYDFFTYLQNIIANKSCLFLQVIRQMQWCWMKDWLYIIHCGYMKHVDKEICRLWVSAWIVEITNYLFLKYDQTGCKIDAVT